MSSLLKKKGALSFKPKKAPAPRRPAGTTPATISSTLSSVEPQSQTQTPAPSTEPPSTTIQQSTPASTSDRRPSTSDQPPSTTINDSPQTEPTANHQQHTKAPVSTQTHEDDQTRSVPAQSESPLVTVQPQTSTVNSALSTTTQTHPDTSKQELVPSTNVDTASNEAPVPRLSEVLEADVGDVSMISVATADSSILSPERGAARDIASLINFHALRSPVKPAPKPIPGVTAKTIQKPALRKTSAAPSVRDSPAAQLPTPQATQDVELSDAAPEADTIDLSRLGAGEAARPGENVPEVPLNADGTIEGGDPILTDESHVPSVTSPKRKRNDGVTDDVRPTIEAPAPKPKRVRGPAKTPRKKKAPADPNAEPKKRKKRAGTPSDAEDQEIDHSTMKMAELCKDIKIGKKFSKHDEIKQREIQRKAKAKLGMGGSEAPEGSNAGTPQPAALLHVEPEPAPILNPGGGPRMRLVDGQIVIDDSSLVVDRHKRAAAEALVLEEIEENDFTRVVTSGSFMKRENSQAWGLEELELFYDGLRMFGTDFEMISKMFPNRNRRQIKLKFNKEEKLYPKRIAKTLVGEKVPIDFEQYASRTGIKYEEVADIEGEAAKIQAVHDAEQKKIDDEAAEVTRRKKAAIQGRLDHTEGDSAKENGGDGGESNRSGVPVKARGKTNAKKKRNLHSVRGGGEEVEVLGSI